VPSSVLSKVLFDLESKHARIEIKDNPDGTMSVTGIGPVRLLMNYQKEIVALTHGKGKYSCVPDGYYPCEDADTIIIERGYDSETDFRNPTGSVFCAQGSGYVVPWDEVEEHLHIPIEKENTSQSYHQVRYTVKEEELKRVFNMAGGQNKKAEPKIKLRAKPKPKAEISVTKVELTEKLPDCLIVDGYNMIYAWENLKDIARTDIESARDQLIDLLTNYQGYRNCRVIIVFDGYRVKNNPGETIRKGDTQIIYTRQGQTADSYIEKSIHDLKKSFNVIVVTSDALIQNSALAQGASRMSARELENRVKKVNSTALAYLNNKM
jgi:predicted RNA-binding protein with PIN domain